MDHKPVIQTSLAILKIAGSEAAELMFQYCQENRSHLEPWEPERDDEYYSLAGSNKLYVNIDYLKPGAKSAKFHSHTLKEEFFLILKGSGYVRIDDEILAVKQGDFFSKPAGEGIAHQFVNDSDGVLEILDCGINDKNDVVEYPDEGVVLVHGKAYEKTQQIKNWTSDPN